MHKSTGTWRHASDAQELYGIHGNNLDPAPEAPKPQIQKPKTLKSSTKVHKVVNPKKFPGVAREHAQGSLLNMIGHAVAGGDPGIGIRYGG